MLLDFEIQRCTRRCAATDQELRPGDVCYSVLEVRGAEIVRKDYSIQSLEWPAGRVLQLVEIASPRAQRQTNQAGAE